MPNTYTVHDVGETFRQGNRDEPSTVTEFYRISAVSPITDTALAVAEMQVANQLPYIGELYVSPFATTGLRANMRARSVDAKSLPGGNMEVEVRWSTRYCWRDDFETALLVPRKNISYREVTRDVYRTGSLAAKTSTSDIGGKSVDLGGRPIPKPSFQGLVSIYVLIDSTQSSLSSIDSNLKTYIGKINSATFLGYAAECLLCTAAELEHEEDEYFVFRAQFAYDPDDQYIQKPDMLADGTIELRDDATNGKGAKTVKWFRDYGTTDFNNLFSGGIAAYLKHRAEKGEFAYP